MFPPLNFVCSFPFLNNVCPIRERAFLFGIGDSLDFFLVGSFSSSPPSFSSSIDDVLQKRGEHEGSGSPRLLWPRQDFG